MLHITVSYIGDGEKKIITASYFNTFVVSSSGTRILTEPVLRYLNRKMSQETTSSPRALK